MTVNPVMFYDVVGCRPRVLLGIQMSHMWFYGIVSAGWSGARPLEGPKLNPGGEG